MSTELSFHYDPDREGLGQLLGDLELAVMQALWEHGEASVRELLPRIGRPVAYSSVITVTNRLAQKGLLARRKEGRTFFYAPCLTRDELRETAARRILGRVRDIAPPSTVVSLMEQMIDESPETLDALERLIEQRKKEK